MTTSFPRIEFSKMKPFLKSEKLEFFFYAEENIILISKLNVWGSRELLVSPEGHYRFMNISVEKNIIFLGLKDEPLSIFIYDTKTNSFIKNPIDEKSYSFYPGYIKKDNFIILNCKGYGCKHKRFCPLTKKFF